MLALKLQRAADRCVERTHPVLQLHNQREVRAADRERADREALCD